MQMNATTRERIPYAIIAGLLVVMFWKAAGVMWGKWFEESSYYSHGPLIPLVGLFLIWRLRDGLAQIPVGSSRLGLAILLLALFVRLFGAYTRVNFVTGFSVVMVLVGLVLYLFGKKITLKLLFPLLFFAWMVPLPDVTIIRISYELKTFASEIATRVMPYIGVTVVKAGSTLYFMGPNDVSDKLIIDDVCSGLRSMIALLAFGSVFAYITRSGLRHRLELFAASIPCSVIANMTRIVIITLVAHFWGSSTATGKGLIPNPFGEAFTIHDATGVLIFVVAFIGFFTYEKLLNPSAFRLPPAQGPKKWLYEHRGQAIALSDSQLDCLIRAGHVAADDKVRPNNSPNWQKAGGLVQFAASPRNNGLVIEDSGDQVTFEECATMARNGRLSKDSFLGYRNGTLKMRAGNLDFLRPYWAASPAKKLSYLALYVLLPVVLFFVVSRDPDLGSLARGKPGAALVTITVWFAIRSVLLIGAIGVRLMRPAEKPMPSIPGGENQ